MYNDILQQFPAMRTPAAVEQTEQILDFMRDLAKLTPSIQPNLFIYDMACAAWTRSGNPNATDSIWQFVEKMKAGNIEPDLNFYAELIFFLTESNRVRDAKRAMALVRSKRTVTARISDPTIGIIFSHFESVCGR